MVARDALMLPFSVSSIAFDSCSRWALMSYSATVASRSGSVSMQSPMMLFTNTVEPAPTKVIFMAADCTTERKKWPVPFRPLTPISVARGRCSVHIGADG